MLETIKSMLFEKKSDQQILTADDTRKLVKAHEDAEYAGYAARKDRMFKEVCKQIRVAANSGGSYLLISTAPTLHSHKQCLKEWTQEDIDWFAEDFKNHFTETGFKFIHETTETWNHKSILIEW